MVHLENFGMCVRSEAFCFNKSVLNIYFITRTCISIHTIRQRRYGMHSMDSLSHIFTFSNHELLTQKKDICRNACVFNVILMSIFAPFIFTAYDILRFLTDDKMKKINSRLV